MRVLITLPLIIFLFFVLNTRVSAAVLPRDHFLYPADQEFVFASGLGSFLTVSGVSRILERCADGTFRQSDEPICEASTLLTNYNRELHQMPWNQLSAQVIFFGERHPDQDIKKFLEAQMAKLSWQGVNTFAFEMFNSSQQPLLDKYHEGQISIDEVKTALERVWGYDSEPYLRVIESAKKYGMRILALDGRDRIGHLDFFEEIHARDEHMALILATAIDDDPNLKIAVLTGRLHAYKSFSVKNLTLSLPALLRIHFGINTQSVISFGKNEPGGYNIIQKALNGKNQAAVTVLPKSFEYSDFILFLR